MVWWCFISRLVVEKDEHMWMGVLQTCLYKQPKKLFNFSHSFMKSELLGFAEFLLKSMSEISGWFLNDIKLIAMDGKFDQVSFNDVLPGMFPW